MASEVQLELPASSAAAQDCPRCQKPLIDPSGLGWCKSCGYCRSLEAEQDNQLLKAAPSTARGELLTKAAAKVPMWFWVLTVGIGALAAMSIVVSRFLPAGNVLPRAVWTSVQISIGLLFVFGAQLYAVVQIAPDDERLSFKDALVPTRLWGLVLKRLPKLGGSLCIAIWGGGLVLFAVLFVGGLRHWFSYLPGAEKASPTPSYLRR